jgi:hypothetical protein
MSSEYISEWMFSMATAGEHRQRRYNSVNRAAHCVSSGSPARTRRRDQPRNCWAWVLTLKAVEAACLGDLNLRREVARNVLEDDAVGRGKEGQDVLDEVLLVVVELLPVRHILAEVDLLDSPEAGLRVGNARGEGSQPAGRAVTGWAPLQRMGRGGAAELGGARRVTSCFLYISQTCWYLIGNSTKRWGLGARRGSVDAMVLCGSDGCSVQVCCLLGLPFPGNQVLAGRANFRISIL